MAAAVRTLRALGARAADSADGGPDDCYYGDMSRRPILVAGLIAGLAVTTSASNIDVSMPAEILLPTPDQDLTREDAVRMEKKLDAIMARGAVPPKQAKPLRTSFTEKEVNSYFKFNSQTFPTGVVNPRLVIAEGGKLRATATVDLTAIRKAKERSWYDPMNLVGGTVDLLVTGTLKSNAGMGTLVVESAWLGNIPIPKPVLQEVISYYTKSPEMPDGFDLDKPFTLPVGIREVEVQRGTMTIVQ